MVSQKNGALNDKLGMQTQAMLDRVSKLISSVLAL